MFDVLKSKYGLGNAVASLHPADITHTEEKMESLNLNTSNCTTLKSVLVLLPSLIYAKLNKNVTLSIILSQEQISVVGSRPCSLPVLTKGKFMKIMLD